ncbi:hypothetical protein B0T22DRAFT_1873 [Podospora appendiculata]|uniref:Uncharacterized protein n=1 Tax=Podospora appendiculata TaxID=314037 RepID=A0AAE0XEI5_9PEZI|nr:hypothetical protein B0T22DRAFT_1873 [Podospora appendiculata]
MAGADGPCAVREHWRCTMRDGDIREKLRLFDLFCFVAVLLGLGQPRYVGTYTRSADAVRCGAVRRVIFRSRRVADFQNLARLHGRAAVHRAIANWRMRIQKEARETPGSDELAQSRLIDFGSFQKQTLESNPNPNSSSDQDAVESIWGPGCPY